MKIVKARWNGLCEACERHFGADGLDAHHVFGRGNQIRRKYADMPALIAPLCRECHDEVTANPRCRKAELLKRWAAQRFCRAMGVDRNVGVFEQGPTPLQVVRGVIRYLDEQQEAA